MFKIGNSKELPTIPDHLSDVGKDFIWECLPRNPVYLPSAAELLGQSATLLERPILESESSDPPPGVTDRVKALMGGRSSKEVSWRQDLQLRSTSSGWSSYPGYTQPQYGQESQSYAPQEIQSYAPQQTYSSQLYYPPPEDPPPEEHGVGNTRKLDRRYSRIADDYKSLDQVTEALARAGLESFNLIVGIDFTKSNEWTGSRSFNRRSLHHISDGLNPYQEAISIIGKTLDAFDEDNLIPCFGFGDASTHDADVFSFYPDERFCNGFEEVLSRYREIVPHVRLAGPTSFAPIIEMAMTIVEQSGGQYHILLIIADGQVTRSVDTEDGHLSPQEQKTVDAILAASKLPLSIILVGVGDWPCDMMKEFDDNIPARAFDNFQFVNFTEIMSKNNQQSRKETEFALSALIEIPSQYKAVIELNILGRRLGNVSERVALLPPPFYDSPSSSISKPFHSTSFNTNAPYQGEPSYQGESQPVSSAPPVTSSTYDNQLCAICLTNQKDMAFGCGHQTCCECGQDLQLCPMCRSPIQTRIKLY